MPLPPISDEDREHILRHTIDLWPQLAGSRIFITGGTGFYGKWLLEAIVAANDACGANIRATLLSRDPARFGRMVPHLASRPEISWIRGDTADFAFPNENFDYLFHLATASAAEVAAGGAAIILHTLRGTERVLRFAKSAGVRRLLFASSGAVYGRQPPELDSIPEDYRGAPDPTDPASGYGEMKRLCEHMCIASRVECVIGRGFSFVGPYLPLTDKFAVGSFIRDALAGGPIVIKGDGSPVRGYLYSADLAVCLLTLLVNGQSLQAYNVGSDQPTTLLELASMIGAAHSIRVELRRERAFTEQLSTHRYVPTIRKYNSEIQILPTISLDIGLQRTLSWAALAHERMAEKAGSRRAY